MRLAVLEKNGRAGMAASADGSGSYEAFDRDTGHSGDLDLLIGQGKSLGEVGRKLLGQAPVFLDGSMVLLLLRSSGKILCVGLNYADHTAESGHAPQAHLTVVARFTLGLIGHITPVVRPLASTMLDYEGGCIAATGRDGRSIVKEQVLDHVAGCAWSKDGSTCDCQSRTPQWTVGRDFDETGPFGPRLVTPDVLPPGCEGLCIVTRLSGQTMQSASTSDRIFNVADLVSMPRRGAHLVVRRPDRHRHARRGGRRAQATGLHEARRHLPGRNGGAWSIAERDCRSAGMVRQKATWFIKERTNNARRVQAGLR